MYPLWHTAQKKQLFLALALPLKLCTHKYDQLISFTSLHSINKRATPDQMIKYKTALMLYKIYNNELMQFEYQQLYSNQNFNQRLKLVNIREMNNLKIGKNLITNKLSILNNQIPYDWLNLSLLSYKLKCQDLLLKNLNIFRF